MQPHPAPRGQRIRIGRRYAREGEIEDYLSAFVRSERAISEAARKVDISCAQALPKDLGDWRSTIEFVMGPYSCGKDLNEVSAVDFSKSDERDIDAFCKLGFGGLLGKLAGGIPVQLGTRPPYRMEVGPGWKSTPHERSSKTAIVTVSTNVLAAGRSGSSPSCPDACRMPSAALGSYEHIAPNCRAIRSAQADDLIFESRPAHAPPEFWPIPGRRLSSMSAKIPASREARRKAMVDFALEWLGLYGSNSRKPSSARSATMARPWVLGSFSCASVGGQPSRRALMEPVNGRLWFAGEAVHETLWGTVGGAWDSGERAAVEALKRIGAITEPPPPQQRARPQQRRVR